MTAQEFTATIRIVQRHHLIFAVSDDKWQIQTRDGDVLDNVDWTGVVFFAENAKNVPTDGVAIDTFNASYMKWKSVGRDAQTLKDLLETDDAEIADLLIDTQTTAFSILRTLFSDKHQPDEVMRDRIIEALTDYLNI